MTRKCKACRTAFEPVRPMQNACGIECALALATVGRVKREKKVAAADRRETRAKLEKLKTRAQWLKEAKTEIQRFRRLEEMAKGSGCISCGRSQQEVESTDAWKPGGAWDGGHYMSKGARPELALEPLNIWLQCKSCNGGSGKYARKGYTVAASFRANLIPRIGIELVEWLEGAHTAKHYTIDDLREIKATYAAKTRELLKAKP
jgi:hypothetical protein